MRSERAAKLPEARIDGDHLRRTMLEQHSGEPPGGRADVQADPAVDFNGEGVQGRSELVLPSERSKARKATDAVDGTSAPVFVTIRPSTMSLLSAIASVGSAMSGRTFRTCFTMLM